MIESHSGQTAACADPAGPAAAADAWQVFGVGSPHGDDQIGWLLAQRLAEVLEAKAGAQILRTPSELLLGERLHNRIVICDGCQGASPVGTLRLIAWPDEQIALERFSGSHDVGLPAVLELLDRLGRLPAQVWLCTVEIAAAVPGSEISPIVLAALSSDKIRQLAQAAIRRQ